MPKPIVQEIRAIDKTKGAFSSITKSVNGLRGVLAGLGAAVSVGALTSLTKNALNSADEIQKLSQRLGASTEALSQYRLVADLTGVSFKTLTTGLQRATRRISEAARGTGEAQGALAELGLEATKLNQLRPEEQFEVLADAIMNVGSSADQVRIAMKLFDTEGVALLQTMQGGSKAIQDMRKEADALGLTLSKDAADGAAAANDALTKFGALTNALGLTLARVLGPAINQVVTWLQVNLPSAAQVAIDAFYTLQQFVLDSAGVVTSGLSSIAGGFASVADFVGADRVASALQKTADGYENVSRTLAKASVRVGGYADAQNNAIASIETGITFNQLYNAALAQGIPKTEAAAKATKALTAARDKDAEAIQQYLANLQREVDILGLTNSELREYELRKLGATQAQINSALALQDELETYEAIAAIERENQAIMERSIELTNQQGDAIKKTKGLGEELGPVMADAFGDAITEGGNFSDILKGLEKDLIRVLTRSLVTRQLTDALSGFLGGGTSGGFLASIFGRALGGPVSTGRPYVVGERGPEMFVPSSSGRVIPANETAQSGGVFQFHFHGVQDADSFRRNKTQMVRMARQAVGT